MVDENGLAKEEIFVDGFHLSQYLMPLVLDFFERIKRD
jgi:hypothetical protein